MINVRSRNYCEIAERLVPHAFRNQASRRMFAVLGNALALATIASALLDLGDVAIVFGLGASFGCAMFLGAVLVPAGPMTPDEARIRDAAHKQAYAFAGYVLFPAALVGAAAISQRDGIQVVWAFMAACLMFWGLPSTLIAWQWRDKVTEVRTDASSEPVVAKTTLPQGR